jgi:hypothetical protein
MSESEDDTWFTEAGFSSTPPTYRFDPALDVASLQDRLAELSNLQHASCAAERNAVGVAAELARPFCDADLLRAYDDSACETLIITFGGLNRGVAGMLTPEDPQFEFVGTLRRIGVSHALFVRDPLQSWYMRGCAIDSSGQEPDPFDSLVHILRREVASLRPSRLVTIGASMGGYAAIRAALSLGADAAIGFGPQVFLHPEERRHLRLPWQVMDSPLEDLVRDLANVGILNLEQQSLSALVRASAPQGAAQQQTRVILHVGGRQSDLFEARLLEEAACTVQRSCLHGDVCACDVAVHVHVRRGHNLAFQMRADGFLEPLLRSHLVPLGAAVPAKCCATEPSVEAIVAMDNNGELPPVAAGARPIESPEDRLENVRRANAGVSVWLARDERVKAGPR